jgi:DNA-binding PadR family transcriptional regulator
MSGYDLRQMIERSTANFWSESFGQIYPSLKKLTDAGLVSMEEQQPEGQRLRKVYRLTPKGRTRLNEWLAEPCGTQVKREELLLKLFFGDRAPAGAMRSAVEERRDLLRADLARYEEIRKQIEGELEKHAAAPYWKMTVEFGIAEASAQLGWCERTLAELKRLEKENAKQTTRGGSHAG